MLHMLLIILTSGNPQEYSFSTAKRRAVEVFTTHKVTFYCGCAYNDDLIVNHTSCGYRPQNTSRRSNRVEWEHVVPASRFGVTFSEWVSGHSECKSSGRHCAEKTNLNFRRMLTDLHNLYPTIGEINNARSNYPMFIIIGEYRRYGECDVEIFNKKIEPRPSIRGDIARTYLYMDNEYPGRLNLTTTEKTIFYAWNLEDPVDKWECTKNKAILEIQGNSNKFIENNCNN